MHIHTRIQYLLPKDKLGQQWKLKDSYNLFRRWYVMDYMESGWLKLLHALASAADGGRCYL